MDYAKATKNIRGCLADYISDYKLKSLVLGISGGIDSALCAALAKPVCDSLGIPLIGRGLPASTNKGEENNRADAIGKNFCHNYEIINIDECPNIIDGACYRLHYLLPGNIYQDGDINKIRRGNLMARVRMIILYDLAQLNKGMVLSTDNYTEYLLGFWSIHGDVGDWGAIQNMWKTEVYEMSQWLCNNENYTPEQRLALSHCIFATPTDGLGISNSDMDQIGCKDYYEVDKILKEWLGRYENQDSKRAIELSEHPVITRHLNTDFKRNNPFNISREEIVK